MLEQKLNSLNVKEDDLCGDPESNVLNPKHNEIEKKLRKFIFCKGKGDSNKILEFNG